MLDSFSVVLTQLLLQRFVIVIVEVEVGLAQNGVLLHHLVQDVDVERQSFGALQLLDQLATNRAANAVLVVQLGDAVGAESMAAVD